jgi:putative alpha-1,2-mannosidase
MIGKEKTTRVLVKEIMNKSFGINPAGLPGNDDCGTISGWFVFSALGFYPFCPASDSYRLGIPLFKRVTIELNEKYYPGKELVIIKESEELRVILLNDLKQINFQVSHSELVKGGKLIFR